MVLASRLAPAQEALQSSLAGDAAAEARNLQQQSGAYTIKSGDFRLLLTPGMAFDWNDNINLSHDAPLSDFIIFPSLGLNISYPVSQQNLLQLNVTFGYQDYLEHNQYSTWYVQSGSVLSFDIYVKDFKIDLHDRFSYVQNSSQQAAVANTGMYGALQNTAGVTTTWDLEDVTLSLGLDYLKNFSTSSQFNQTDYSSLLGVLRGGFKFRPTLTAGLEATVARTAYDQTSFSGSLNQPSLNNNINYSAGVFADWRPGTALRVQPRLGYTYYVFDQTSSVIPASNQGAWYLDLTVAHQLTKSISYSLSAGRELTLGIYGDNIEDWYARTSIGWNVIKDLQLTTSLSYQNGSQGIVNTTGALAENFNWCTGSVGLSRKFTKQLTLALNYVLTLRASNYQAREYSQNLVGLQLAYSLQ